MSGHSEPCPLCKRELSPPQVHWLAAMLAMMQSRDLGLLPGRLK